MNQSWKIEKPLIGLYYVPDYLERKAIHRYLEAYHPDVHKTSFSKSTRTNRSEWDWMCPHCHVIIDVYLHEDETYSSFSKSCGTPGCYTKIDWKLTYHHYIIGLNRVGGNVIAFGDFFKSYNNPPLSSEKIPSTEEVHAILATKPILLLSMGEEFEELRAKRQSTIAEWIHQKIKKREYILQK